MATKTSTTSAKTKTTTKKTTPAKVSTNKEKSTTPIKSPLEFYPKAMQISHSENGKNFFWYEYSPRCAAITAEDFETVYYFAFPTEETGIAFMNAISEKFCKDSLMRSPKRFDAAEYPFEVKVWGMLQKTFFGLVKRDLAAQEQINSPEK